MLIIIIPFLLSFLTLTQPKAPLQYFLVSNITFPNITATKVLTSDKLFLCYSQRLDIYSSLDGTHLQTIDFSSVATGSTLNCLDAYENNTYCLFSKGTIMIRYDVQAKTYVVHDFVETGNTVGRLLMGGGYAVMNAPSVAKIYILNFTTMLGVGFKPLTTAVTAAYNFQVNTKGTEFAVYQARRMFIYVHNPLTFDWTLAYNTTLSPMVGSSIYFLVYSPSGKVFYNTRGNQIVQTRNTTDYSVLSQRTYASFVTLTVSNIQFTNTLGDELSIQLYNSTSNSSFLQIYNISTGVSEYKNLSDGKTTSFQAMRLYPSQRVMVLYYQAYGCEVYELRCPVGTAVYSEVEGMCLYCNQTTLCNVAVVNGTTNSTTNVTVNGTNNVTVNGTTNSTTNITVNGTTNSTTNITVNSTTNVTVNGTTNNSTSNVTVNGTTANTTANSTTNNTTVNGTTPPLNNTTNTNQTNTTNNTTNPITPTTTTPQFTPFQQQAIQISGRLYSIPTLRQSLKSFSYLFLAIDSLWMYQYHNRTYGKEVKNIFESVRRIEDMKFSFFSIIDSAYEFIGNTQSQIQTLTNCIPYTNANYLKTQNKDGSFLSNSLDFILFHIPGTFLSFMLCRMLYTLFKNCKIGSLFRLYGFWGYFLVCLLQPNVEYFSFLLGNEFHLSFFFDYLNKIFAVFWIGCLFLIIVGSVGLMFLLKGLYDRKVRLFMENTRDVGWGVGWIIFTMTIKRMFTGITHSYLYYYPTHQLICLILAEITELSLMFFLWKRFKLFPEHIAVWARMLMNLIMISFQLLLLLDGFLDVEVLGELVDGNIYEVVLCLFGCTFVFCVMGMVSGAVESCRHKKLEDEENKVKSNTAAQTKQNTFKSIKQWKSTKYDTQQQQQSQQTQAQFTTINYLTPNCIPTATSKKKTTLKVKSKFNISAQVISQKAEQEQDNNRSSFENQQKGQQTQLSYHMIDQLREDDGEDEDYSPVQSNSKSMVSIRNMISSKNVAVKSQRHLAIPKSQNGESNVSINFTSRNKSKKKATFLSYKKIKTAVNIPKAHDLRAELHKNNQHHLSIKSGVSRQQTNSVVFVEQQQPIQTYQRVHKPVSNQKKNEVQIPQRQQGIHLSMTKSYKKIKSIKSIKSIRQIITNRPIEDEE